MTPAPKTGPNAVAPILGGNRREHGGGRTRFIGTAHHADRVSAALRADHPAVTEGRTLFPTRVKQMHEVPRVLVSGYNNAKIGARVEKGLWAGMPILTLTLEERATCPRTCENWQTCFGNAMPMPRRHAHGADLVARLDQELRAHAVLNPRGFVVRLHILGDFYSVEYVAAWKRWLHDIPELHVFGYTARLPGTDIGDYIQALNVSFPDCWRMRFSVAADAPIAPMQVTTIWRQPDVIRQPEGAVCPQQFDRTATCGTCGLCWAPANDAERIAFVGHGMSRRKKAV